MANAWTHFTADCSRTQWVAQLLQRRHFWGSICHTVPWPELRVAINPKSPPKPVIAAIRVPSRRNCRRLTEGCWDDGAFSFIPSRFRLQDPHITRDEIQDINVALRIHRRIQPSQRAVRAIAHLARLSIFAEQLGPGDHTFE